MSSLSPIRVLIAEDDFLVSEMVHGLLTEIGYLVVGETNNGVEAVQLMQQLKPDVVMMDIEMPKMNGLDAAAQIYRDCPAPVVILTAYESPQLVQRAREAGVRAYLVKPPNARDLERAITIARSRFDGMLQLRRLNDTLREQNEELNAFSHTVAHNIQSSLSRNIGFSELLQHEFDTLTEDERQQCLLAIVRNGRKVSNIVDELLVLASVRNTEVELQPLNMADIVEEARYRLVDMIQESQIARREAVDAIAAAIGDLDLLCRRLPNVERLGLLGGAFKRLAQIESDGERRQQALARMAEQYALAYARRRDAYAFTNHVAALLLANRGTVAVDAENRAKLLGELDGLRREVARRNADDPNF